MEEDEEEEEGNHGCRMKLLVIDPSNEASVDSRFCFCMEANAVHNVIYLVGPQTPMCAPV